MLILLDDKPVKNLKHFSMLPEGLIVSFVGSSDKNFKLEMLKSGYDLSVVDSYETILQNEKNFKLEMLKVGYNLSEKRRF